MGVRKPFVMSVRMDRDKAGRLSCAKLTEKQFAAAAARHELLYSGRVGGARAIFAFCDLSGLDLSGRNLADADFTGAYLEETNLSGARLDSASFFGASLKRANLAGSSLRRADMRGTSLRGSNLIGADMYEADLREGKIAEKGTSGDLKVLQHDIGPTEMPAALLSAANLERAKLSGYDLRSLKGLPRAILTALIAPEAVFYGLDLTGARLQGAQLEGADLRGCKLTGADLRGANLKGAKLANADLRDVNLGPLL